MIIADCSVGQMVRATANNGSINISSISIFRPLAPHMGGGNFRSRGVVISTKHIPWFQIGRCNFHLGGVVISAKFSVDFLRGAPIFWPTAPRMGGGIFHARGVVISTTLPLVSNGALQFPFGGRCNYRQAFCRLLSGASIFQPIAPRMGAATSTRGAL